MSTCTGGGGVGVGPFLLSKKHFCYQNTRILTYSDPYSTHFAKTTVFYRIHQERTRRHKNTSKFRARAPNSAKVREYHRIPQEYRVAFVFSKSSHRIRRPSEYHSRIRQNRAEYTKEYRILHRIQNTAKNTVSYMQNTARTEVSVWCVCASLSDPPR